MIRKHSLLLGFSLAAAVLLAGCTSDLMPTDYGSEQPLRLSVSTETVMTRAADGLYTASAGFGGGEQVEVYVNSSTKHGTYQVNSTTPTKLDALTGQEQYYPTSGDVSLYAVYPAASATNGSHTVKYDQTSDVNYKQSDLMYAKKTVSQADKSNEQQLQFGHQLVKLKVKIIKAASVTEVTKVEMKNVKRRVSVSASTSSMSLTNLASATGEAANAGNNEDKILIFQGSNTSTTEQTYACVFPDQDWSNADFITVTADDKEATYKLTKNDFTFGHEYTLTLNINAAALGNTVSIDTWTDGGSATISPTASELSIDIDDQTYTGSALMPSFTIKDASDNTVATISDGNSTSDFDIYWQNNTNAGTATVAAVGKGTYAGKACAKNFTINKADATYTAPSAKTGLTYTGSAQALANAGTSGHGTFTYCATQNGTYTTTIPTGTNAGSSYAVYWKLTGDSNHNDASGSLTSISIAKATPSVTAPTAKPSLLYTGSALELINAGSTTAGCTMQYRLDGSSTWSSDAASIKGTAAQEYTVYYKVVGNDNYNDVTQQSITASIVTYRSISSATTADIGKVVCAAGHLHDAKTAVPSGCTAVGVLGKVTSTGHGLIVALKNAADQTWNTINGWSSITAYASTTLKLLPDNTARGSLTSYTSLGGTTVSNWCVGQKTDYEPIMQNLGSQKHDSDGYTYDSNVNAYFTNNGGDAFDGNYWSATEYTSGNGWFFLANGWGDLNKADAYHVRPLLAF